MIERFWPLKEMERFLRYEDPEVRCWAADRLARHYPEDAAALLALAPALVLLLIEQPRQARIQHPGLKKQNHEHEGCSQKAVDAANIEAEVEAPRIEDRTH